jgi:hypothetical protein
MSDPPPGNQSKKSRLQQPKFKDVFSKRRNPSPSPQVAQSVTPPNISAQGTEYTAIVELSTTPSGPLTWEQRMKEGGSTAYEGLKTAIQGVYNCSDMFPPLKTAARVFLTISQVVDVRGSMCSTCK